MSKPPPSFWQDPEGDGVEVEPPVEPSDADEEPGDAREPDVVPADADPEATETADVESPHPR
jgi:hypothetical protein